MPARGWHPRCTAHVHHMEISMRATLKAFVLVGVCSCAGSFASTLSCEASETKGLPKRATYFVAERGTVFFAAGDYLITIDTDGTTIFKSTCKNLKTGKSVESGPQPVQAGTKITSIGGQSSDQSLNYKCSLD